MKGPVAGSGGKADLVRRGGDVYVMGAARSWTQAVAVAGGRIAAAGTDAEIAEWVGPQTEVVELGGRMVLPGFQDAHIHTSAAGLARIRCDLSGAHSLADYLTIVRAYAKQHPDAPWITGGGWSMDVFPGGVARREDLDRVVPDRPVFLSNGDHHAAWVNSAALVLAGIGAGTPTRRTAGSSGTRMATPPAPCRRGPWTWPGGTCPARP